MKPVGQTVLITGGTSGIGLELARQLLALGNCVIITGRDEQKLAAALTAHPGLHGIQSDASDVQAIIALHAEIITRFPELNILVNNAGIMRTVALGEDRTLDDVTQEIDIELSGPIRITQQFLPHLLARPDAMIVNVSSALAFVPLAMSPIYSAAKAALHAYTRCLRVQLARSNVAVIELAPPLTETPLYSDEYKGLMNGARGMPVAALVRQTIDGMQRRKAEIRPGQSRFLHLANRLAPSFIFSQLSKVGMKQRPQTQRCVESA